MTVLVKKLGGSVAVVIPKSVASEMGLAVGTALDVTASADAIVMRKGGRRHRRPLRDIVAKITPANYRRRGRESLDSDPVGEEIW